MQPYRPDRVVRALTAFVSFWYNVFWVVGVFVLALLPAAKLFHFGGDKAWTMLPVPAVLRDADAPVRASWGTGLVVVEDGYGILKLTIPSMPWGVVFLVWLYLIVGLGLLLLTLHHLRRIFQRVRDGAPFDAQNAVRMRTVGLLMLAAYIVDAVAEYFTGLALKRELTGGPIGVSLMPDVEIWVIFSYVVVIALAEIFRRGAELEDEQALVV